MHPCGKLLLALASITPVAALADEPVWPDGTIFAEPPARAAARPGSPCAVAERYVTLIGADRAPEVVDLFADDGSVFSSLPRFLKGREAITRQYATVHNSGAIPVGFIETGRECAVTIAALLDSKEAGGPRRYGLLSMNHFTLKPDGKIERLIIYVRPDALARMPH